MYRKTVFSVLIFFVGCIQIFAYDFTALIDGHECHFNVIERGVCEITSGQYAGDMVLPYSVEHEGVEYYIARIGDHAFLDCKELVSIDISHACEVIGREAFHNCTGLKKVIVRRNLADIKVDETAFDTDESGRILCTLVVAEADIVSAAGGIWSQFSALVIDPITDEPMTPTGTIPTLYIDTEGQKPITSKTEYVNATYSVENAGEYNIGPLAMQIRGRGNSSWRGEKKPYKLKLDAKAKLLGMKNNRLWALINGNTWTRLMGGLDLGNRVGLAWSPSSRPVEVVLNGEYIGLYLLMETVRTDKNRVNIGEQPDMCSNPDSLAGGWLVEVDNYYDERQMIVPECPQWQMRVTWHTPENLSYQQREWLRREFTQMNADIYSEEKDDALLASHIDLDAMAQFFIAQEVMDNPDGFHGSFFLHKPYGNPSLWTAGPLWDVTCMERDKTDYTYRMKVSYGFTPHLIGELLKYGSFRDSVNAQWERFYPVSADEWLQDISEMCSVDKYAAADKANNERWPNASYKGLEEKLNRTIYWYRKNVEWFSQHLPSKSSVETNTEDDINQSSSAIYTLQGIRLKSEPRHGVFIRGGRKIVIK